MSIKVSRLTEPASPQEGEGQWTVGMQINFDSNESFVAFSEMVRRALNCWPDAHPELKELGDMLMHGKVLQDYWASRTDIKHNKLSNLPA